MTSESIQSFTDTIKHILFLIQTSFIPIALLTLSIKAKALLYFKAAILFLINESTCPFFALFNR
jgi:hypothetical protein